MLATGFFRVDCALTLQRLYCLLVIEIGSRYVHIPGITANPDGPRRRCSPGTGGWSPARGTTPAGAVPVGRLRQQRSGSS